MLELAKLLACVSEEDSKKDITWTHYDGQVWLIENVKAGLRWRKI